MDARTRPAGTILLTLWLLLLLVHVPAQAGEMPEEVSSGLDWLESRAGPSGVIAGAGDVARPVQSSAEALAALAAWGRDAGPRADAARAFLEADLLAGPEALARRIGARAATGLDAADLVAELLALENPDGGYGTVPGQGSALVDSAWALIGLAAGGVPAGEPARRALAWILTAQGADGLWPGAGPEAAELHSALALRALWGYRQLGPEVAAAITTARTALLARRDAGGRWSTFEADLEALAALLPLAASADDLGPALQGLRAEQLREGPDAGSWRGDAYLSARALQVLAWAARPVPDPDLASLGAQVVDAHSGFPLPGASVHLHGPLEHGALSDAEGRVHLGALPAGAYTLSLEAQGYGALGGPLTLTSGQHLDLGTLALVPADASATGTVRGTVRAADSGAALAGVSVEVAGAGGLLGESASGADGQYLIGGLEPGTVTVTVQHPGYHPAAGSGTLAPGGTLLFHATLEPESGPPPAPERPAAVGGVVLDSTTGAPLAAVVVSAEGAGYAATTTSGPGGDYSFGGIDADALLIRFSHPAYHPVEFEFRLGPGAHQQIGQIRLRPLAATVLMPDLIVEHLERGTLGSDPHSFVATGELAVTVVNAGTAPAGAFEVVAFEDRDGDGRYSPDTDPVLGRATVPDGLAAGERTPLTVAIEGTLRFRDAPVSVWVDSAAQVLEREEDNNLASTHAQCRFESPDAGSFEPVLLWSWNRAQVLSVPLVAPLRDTNGDEVIDEHDDPVVIIVSHTGFVDGSSGTLRALDGKTGAELWAFTEYLTDGSAHPAIADIDGDGVPEIVMYRRQGGVVAVNADGTLKWFSPQPPRAESFYNYGAINIADLDGDGQAEILVYNGVLNSDGSVRWLVPGSFWHLSTAIAVDLTLDGRLEVVLANGVYRENGDLLWPAPGFNMTANAIGRFDDGPFPSIVSAPGGLKRIAHDGTLVWQVAIPSGGGGAPVIADVTGDGQAEIGVAARSRYTVFRADGSILWSQPTTDFSSAVTGSTVFDFDGDGRAEIVYADERFLRVYDGPTGEVVFQIPNISVTATEAPVVADVNGDGRANLLVPSNNTGLRVFRDAANSWMPTRRIWNQHAYHIDNINDDASVPAYPRRSWQTHNTYRLNAFPDRDPLAAADLTAGRLELHDQGTGELPSLSVRIGNAGALTPGGPVEVEFHQGEPEAGGRLLGSLTIEAPAGGAYLDVSLQGVELAGDAPLYATVNPDGAVPECDLTNNRVSAPVRPALLRGVITVATDRPEYGPGETASFSLRLANTGALVGDYRAWLEVTDPAAVVLARLGPFAADGLAAGAAVDFSAEWSTAGVLAGPYRLLGTLYDTEDGLLDTDIAPFAITAGSVPAATITVRTDRAEYHLSDRAELAAHITNPTVNAPLVDARVVLTVSDPQGQVVFETERPLPELAPGAAHGLGAPYAFIDAAPGAYRLHGQVLGADGVVLAEDSTHFLVALDATRALSGHTEALYPVIAPGEAQLCTDTVENTASTPYLELPVRRLLVQADSGEVHAQVEDLIELAGGASRSFSRTLATEHLTPGTWACVLQVRPGEAWLSLALALFEVSAPAVRIEAAFAPGSGARVLILIDPPAPAAAAPGADPHGPHGPAMDEQRAFLEALLTAAGWRYTIVTEAGAFAAEFASGRYSAYALLAEQVRLAGPLQGALTEAVYRGEGLLVAGRHDQRHAHLMEVLGIAYAGKDPHLDLVEVSAEPLGPPGLAPLAHPDRAIPLAPAEAETAGYFHGAAARPVQGGTGPRRPVALTRNGYGAGTAVAAGYDLLAEATGAGDESLHAALILRALEAIAAPASGAGPVAGTVAAVELVLTNTGIATALTVELASEPAAQLIDADPALVPVPGGWHWSGALAEDEVRSLRLWLRVPEGTDSLILTAVVGLPEDPDTGSAGDSDGEHGADPAPIAEVLVTAIYTVPVTPAPDLVAAGLALEALASTDRHARTALKALERARAHHQAGRLGQTFDELLAAGAALAQSPAPEAGGIRTALAWALQRLARTMHTAAALPATWCAPGGCP